MINFLYFRLIVELDRSSNHLLNKKFTRTCCSGQFCVLFLYTGTAVVLCRVVAVACV